MTSPADTPSTDAPARAPSSRRRAAAARGRPRRARAEVRVFPRQFWLLAFGFLVLLCGIDMCFPFETTYLHDRLGFSMTTIGLLLGVPLLCALPFYVLDGAITDRYGRKPAMIGGALFIAGLYATLAFAGVLWQIAIAVSLEAAFGWALFLTGSNAMIADLVALERRAEAYSITRVAIHVGMVIGPLVGAVVIAARPHLPHPLPDRGDDLPRVHRPRDRRLPRDASAGGASRGDHRRHDPRLRARARRPPLPRLLCHRLLAAVRLRPDLEHVAR